MRRTNINAVLRMVREYLNGDMNEIDFYLDFCKFRSLSHTCPLI